MKLPHISHLAILAACTVLSITGALAQQNFHLSSKFYEAQFVRGKWWDGQHRFGNVFCLTFPRSKEAEALANAMYNNNSIYFSRVAYNDMTALYVVTSTVPAGRSVEVEIGNIALQNQRSVDTYPAVFSQKQATGLLGPSLVLIVRNSTEGAKERPFPFARSFVPRSDGGLGSLSVHRLFVRGSDRIEVAGLRYFKSPITPDHEAEAISELSSLVEATADSMQSCTANLPPRQ